MEIIEDAQQREDNNFVEHENFVERENIAVGLSEKKDADQTRQSDRITFRPDNAMMAAIDFEVAEQGMWDRAELVKHAVSQCLGRQKHDRVLLSEVDTVYVSALRWKMRMSRAARRITPSEPTETAHPELARHDGLTISGQSAESHVYPEKTATRSSLRRKNSLTCNDAKFGYNRHNTRKRAENGRKSGKQGKLLNERQD